MTTAPWVPDRPHNELPLLPPAIELETKPVLRRCIEARAALGELKRAAELIPDQAMLINTLPVLEARSSSEIENIVTTADALFEHLDRGSGADPATKEALRYREALMEGFRDIATIPVSTRIAERVCSRIRAVEMSVRRVPGVALANSTSGEIVYTPPEGESRLRDLLGNWERFLNESSDVDPLIRMAVGHYQFEAIHPFTDGNGRTGRVLNSLYLIQEGLLTLPILYLSRYIIRNRAEYYRRLLAVTCDQNWEEWLLYILTAVESTARWTLGVIEAVQDLEEQTAEALRRDEPKLYSRELVEILFRQPYCRISSLVEAGLAKRQTASIYLQRLTAMGLLEERKRGRD
ncbi:Fic family protein, partial [bacterium]